MTSKVNPGDRIAKILSRKGIASRRGAEKLILEGRVKVNGIIIDSPALNLTDKDMIMVDGNLVGEQEPTRIWRYHKPLNLITSTKDDKGRTTVFESLPKSMPKVMSVGRLDINSEGLLLLTNDGALKRILELPSTGWIRKYRVRVQGRPTENTFKRLRTGMKVGADIFRPMEVTIDRQQGANAWLTIGLREGKNREIQAAKGLEKLKRSVDSLIIINNNKLRDVYGNLGFKEGFSKADEVLATAARGVAQVITHHYTQNIDLKDAKTVLSSSGTAIMGSAVTSGSNRANEAVIKALDSPLLNDNKIEGSKNVLLLIVSGNEEITIDEIGEINEHIQNESGNSANIIMGVGEDLELGNNISVTVIATGFGDEKQKSLVSSESKKVIYNLDQDPVSYTHLTLPTNREV